MKLDALASWTLPVCLLLGCMPGCQGYAFEEVTSSTFRVKHQTIHVPQEIDILFVMDNSKSMVGEQVAIAQSFSEFTGVLDEKFAAGKYRIAVITTGMLSPMCGSCPVDNPRVYSCMNESGESGLFQDRRGRMSGSVNDPEFDFESDPSCRIVTSENLDCFYDQAQQRGTILVGTNGCGFERGLEAIHAALSSPLKDAENAGFLRDEAMLAVVVVSDEEDCGAVGDVIESPYQPYGAYTQKACYYSANEAGPDGATQYPPPTPEPFELRPVSEYKDFLVGLKGGHEDMVKFAAIVGVEDPDDPTSTRIHFEDASATAEELPACSEPGCVLACEGDAGCIGYCEAKPATRYVELADLFGLGDGGFIDTICQENFSQTLADLGKFVSCPEEFKLSEELTDDGLANIFVNDVEVPRYTCDSSSFDEAIECAGLQDTSCPIGSCVETWTWTAPDGLDPLAPGGTISFAPHYDPCQLIKGGSVTIELVFVAD